MVVLMITTAAEPMPCSRAMAVASTTAKR